MQASDQALPGSVDVVAGSPSASIDTRNVESSYQTNADQNRMGWLVAGTIG